MSCRQPRIAEMLVPFVEGTLAVRERAQVTDHVRECAACREEARRIRESILALRDAVASGAVKGPSSHPDVDTLARAVCEPHTLEEETRRRVELHLLQCDTCREPAELLQQMEGELAGRVDPEPSSPVIPAPLREEFARLYAAPISATRPASSVSFVEKLAAFLGSFNWRPLAATAMLAAVLGLGYLFVLSGPPTPSEVALEAGSPPPPPAGEATSPPVPPAAERSPASEAPRRARSPAKAKAPRVAAAGEEQKDAPAGAQAKPEKPEPRATNRPAAEPAPPTPPPSGRAKRHRAEAGAAPAPELRTVREPPFPAREEAPEPPAEPRPGERVPAEPDKGPVAGHLTYKVPPSPAARKEEVAAVALPSETPSPPFSDVATGSPAPSGKAGAAESGAATVAAASAVEASPGTPGVGTSAVEEGAVRPALERGAATPLPRPNREQALTPRAREIVRAVDREASVYVEERADGSVLVTVGVRPDLGRKEQEALRTRLRDGLDLRDEDTIRIQSR